MSITARPSASFAADFEDAPSGLGSTLACGIRELPSGTMVAPAVVTGITETDVGATSNYVAIRTAPAVVSDPDSPTGPRYKVVWFISGVENTADDLFVSGAYLDGTDDAIPSVADIAALMHELIQKAGGHTDVAFDADTNPTAGQVQAIIDMQAPLLLVRFGDLTDDALICPAPGPDNIRLAVRTLIAQRVAAVVGLSYRFQDTVIGDTPDEFWRRAVELDADEIVQAARECRLGNIAPGGGEGEGGVSLAPTFQFNTGLRLGDRGW